MNFHTLRRRHYFARQYFVSYAKLKLINFAHESAVYRASSKSVKGGKLYL